MMSEYERWLAQKLDDPDLTAAELGGNHDQPEEINDRFYCNLDFGTADLRGVIGAGTNRMNVYIVRKATQGLADYLNAHVRNANVAIAYDSRIKSDVFAKETAAVLAANGIHAHIYPWLSPVPTLSFATRYLKCDAGVCVTATFLRNGQRLEGLRQRRLPDHQRDGEGVSERRRRDKDVFEGVKRMSFEDGVKEGRISYIKDEVINAFLQEVLNQSVIPEPCKGLKVVYTPLNGSGRVCVTRILDMIGVDDVTVVPEQEMPDGHFTTCVPEPGGQRGVAEGPGALPEGAG